VAQHWPAEIASLVTADTLVLLNKLDLATESAEQHTRFMMMESDAFTQSTEKSPGSNHPDERALPQWWRASVTTGEGMHTFVEGLVHAVKKRYVRCDANAQCPGT
jgi:hypothetical protein